MNTRLFAVAVAVVVASLLATVPAVRSAVAGAVTILHSGFFISGATLGIPHSILTWIWWGVVAVCIITLVAGALFIIYDTQI